MYQSPSLQEIIPLRLSLYLNTQFVPRSKHTPSRLQKPEPIEISPFSPLPYFSLTNSDTNGQEHRLER